ncbi:vitamin K epoxide reductase family protein [Glaciihabitans sp. UYNi722]|uniref:vitamin K epoxide reductase family protein n=1 Tax=Glaciihabitans sp. UYNi722 TaxID=3156344 RepID=UPI0033924296
MSATIAEKPTTSTALWLLIASGLGVIAAFVTTVIAFIGLEDLGDKGTLVGADNELGFPSSALALAIFAIAVATAVALYAGAQIPQGWWIALVIILSLGVIVEVWAIALAFTPLLLVQLVFVVGALVVAARRIDRPIGMGLFLVLASTIGFFSAFRLTVDKVTSIIDPTGPLSCNSSALVQCGKNLGSWQGAIFGFPNPLLGVGGWIAPLAVGIMLLAGIRFARWFWIALNVGIVGALALVIWLIYQSIFALSTLCPWCMVTWAVVIPTFWVVTLHNIRSGNIPLPDRARRFAASAFTWIPLITLVCYVIVAVIAQLRLDLINHL